MARISLGICLVLLIAASTVYEAQATFLLRHYLRKFPRRCNGFKPFACKGLTMFMNGLKSQCPQKAEYTNFFGKMNGFMNFVNTASGSQGFDAQLKGHAQALHSAITQLAGKTGMADSRNVMGTLVSMGKILGQTDQQGESEMTDAQKKELIMSMAKWASSIGQFVVKCASQNGANVDMSSLGVDGIDANAAASGGGSASGDSSTSGSTKKGSSAKTGSTEAGSGSSTEGSTETDGETTAGSTKKGSSAKTGSTEASSGSETEGSTETGGAAAGGSSKKSGGYMGGGNISGSGNAEGSANGSGQTSTKASGSGSAQGGMSYGGSFKFGGSGSASAQGGAKGSAEQTSTGTSN